MLDKLMLFADQMRPTGTRENNLLYSWCTDSNALWETEVSGSPEIKSSSPAWPTWQNAVSTKNKTISRGIGLILPAQVSGGEAGCSLPRLPGLCLACCAQLPHAPSGAAEPPSPRNPGREFPLPERGRPSLRTRAGQMRIREGEASVQPAVGEEIYDNESCVLREGCGGSAGRVLGSRDMTVGVPRGASQTLPHTIRAIPVEAVTFLRRCLSPGGGVTSVLRAASPGAQIWGRLPLPLPASSRGRSIYSTQACAGAAGYLPRSPRSFGRPTHFLC
ncbi:putative uncharacterized protein C8orf44 [Plecturocebus cupreus]